MKSQKYPYYLRSIYNLLTKFKNPKLILSIFLGSYSQETAVVQLRESELRFTVRGAMDVWSIKETFIDRFYEQFGTSIQDGWTVVDIGAGLGDFTLLAACSHPSNKILAFEPFEGSFSLLQENLVSNGAENVQIFQQAVTDKTGEIVLDLTGGEPLQITSGVEGIDNSTAAEQVRVSSTTLKDLINDNTLTGIDLLKLDCEGAEFPILFNTENRTFEQIARIIMEYHDYISGYAVNDLAQFLQLQGYQTIITKNFVHDDLGYLFASRSQEVISDLPPM